MFVCPFGGRGEDPQRHGSCYLTGLMVESKTGYQTESEVISMDVRQMRNEALGKRVVKALESRNMEAYYTANKEEAVQKALELIAEGSTINMGGSASVREVGLIDAINAGNYVFYDRDKAATPEEKQEIALKAFTCDWFLGSVNAMSEDGVFVNIDGNANRVGGLCVRPEECSSHRGDEQDREDRRGRHAQGKK